MLSMDNTSTAVTENGFDYWHHVTCRNFSLSECEKPSGTPFRARISSRRFGPLAISDASSLEADRISMTRGPAQIRADPRDHFMLYLVLDGRIDLEQDDRQARASAGDMFVYDQTMPFKLDFHRSHVILVNVPRPLLVSRIPDVRRLTAQRIAGTTNMGALVGSLVRQMSALDEKTQAKVADRLAISAVDILSATLECDVASGEQGRRVRHRLLPAVKNYMLAHLHEADLDLESIARAMNVAPRTLNRIFAPEGTTPIRWLWQQRLEASYKALSEKRVGSVTDAAFSSGFSDLSHFGRAFRRQFGRLPHTLFAPDDARTGRSA